MILPTKASLAEPRLPRFGELVGREKFLTQLAARMRAHRNGEARFPHTLIIGSPGIGKSALAAATIMALGAPYSAVVGTELKGKTGRWIIQGLNHNGVFYIDDAGFANPRLQRFMARCWISSGPILMATALSVGALVPEFWRQFGLVLRLGPYGEDELVRIVRQHAAHHGSPISERAARVVARQSRGIARTALALLQSLTASSGNARR